METTTPKPYACIGLCVYNNEFGLPFVFENIRRMQCLFRELRIICFYDNSRDKSLEIIEKNSADLLIDLMKNKEKHVLETQRTERIAHARNNILERIRKQYSSCDYFMMMDSNDYSCIGKIRVELLEEVLRRNYAWDSVSFDRDAGYYDTWALSFDPYIYSFFHFDNWQVVVKSMREYFAKLLQEYKKSGDLMPVYSAFNGFAIYKTECFLDCHYSNKIRIDQFPYTILKKQMTMTNSRIVNNFSNDCEHRAFHLEAINKRNVRIRIWPESIFAKFEWELPADCRGPA